MLRDIIQIDEDKCNGCGLCITGCHEGALALVDGKARLISATYCDGLGACLPACPTGAITIVQREADEFVAPAPVQASPAPVTHSELTSWPVQIKLVPIQAPYLQDARLLIAADCTAYARANFHADFMRGRVTLIGCPKLDAGSYIEKFTEIFRHNSIKSIMVVKMEVPCCGGIEHAVRQAMLSSGKMIPWQVVTIGTDGSILAD